MIRADEFASTRPVRYRQRSLLATLLFGLRLRAQRARLAQLDDHLLRDIGLTRAEAENESARPFWNAPLHWHQ